MTFNEDLLKPDEKLVFGLRKLFLDKGYKPFKMSKFEEYDLYSKNKEFLVSDGIITFNDTDGKLLALKPDVTLSIIKNSNLEEGKVEKYFYNESVYRISDSTHTYKEITQTGLECIGSVAFPDVCEVCELALKSLEAISPNFVLNISHIGLLLAVLEDNDVDKNYYEIIFTAIKEKNIDLLLSLGNGDLFNIVAPFINTYKTCDYALAALKTCCRDALSEFNYLKLESLYKALKELGYEDKISIDFSIIGKSQYYSGFVFKGYVDGIPSAVLSGGQYDKLMKKFNKNAGALGFAVYLDCLERVSDIREKENDGYINVALPKGRLGEKVYDLFESAGFECPAIRETNRKLIFENPDKKVRYFWVKPSDVAIYVERGAADVGVCGKDILLEYSPDVYELLDLNLGKCRMAVAAKEDFKDDTSRTLRVATKFSNIAKDYYRKCGRDIDIIHLNGSIEIAPILDLSDVIVDIVETGKTLLENNLKPFETIVPISARLICNKASFGFKKEKIEKIRKELLKKVK